MIRRIISLIIIISTLLTLPVIASEENSRASAKNTGRVVFLLYHDLANGELTDGDDPEYCITAENFRHDIKSLLDIGYKSISCENYLSGDYEKDKNYFCITFDDGYLSNYTVAYPILKELGATGDIFMCTENTYLKNHFNWRQAQEMEESGVIKIYSHTSKHVRLSDTTLSSFSYTVERSLYYLRTKLTAERDMLFSYPNSDYSADSVKKLYDLGVKLQFVQIMPDENFGIDYEKYGLTRRYSVANDSDVLKLIEM